MDSNVRAVYSTEGGWLTRCATCGQPPDRCRCAAVGRRGRPARRGPALPNDGVVRIFRDRKGRGGKTVTVVAGLPAEPETLRELAGQLKRLCGSGGTVAEGGQIEIQGDHRERLAAALTAQGYRVKLAGG
ncbi:MAG: stress response translation initiation inhibitor YciH [Chloroflexi bacterium]|nr:stress response translation initiation inhibitor YciH [Chloroflexota bacterium]